MKQDHKAYPHIAKLIGDCVHHNGGTAGRAFGGIADPAADIMRLLDECLTAPGIEHNDLRTFEAWLASLRDEQFDIITDGEETEVAAIFATAPLIGGRPAQAFVDAAYEHCI